MKWTRLLQSGTCFIACNCSPPSLSVWSRAVIAAPNRKYGSMPRIWSARSAARRGSESAVATSFFTMRVVLRDPDKVVPREGPVEPELLQGAPRAEQEGAEPAKAARLVDVELLECREGDVKCVERIVRVSLRRELNSVTAGVRCVQRMSTGNWQVTSEAAASRRRSTLVSSSLMVVYSTSCVHGMNAPMSTSTREARSYYLSCADRATGGYDPSPTGTDISAAAALNSSAAGRTRAAVATRKSFSVVSAGNSSLEVKRTSRGRLRDRARCSRTSAGGKLRAMLAADPYGITRMMDAQRVGMSRATVRHLAQTRPKTHGAVSSDTLPSVISSARVGI
ncbi:hypothetical protein DFH07DRAFT_816975 [Mycena maculata]|uniref:Uncharacterized protein n=1 Tax=Mycena maculata TaxID=230809 RepID=A0AAD7JDG8_9AGAR|nr:hypothetical protein DFH07DRAFT_816975 [Mycena maculata]